MPHQPPPKEGSDTAFRVVAIAIVVIFLLIVVLGVIFFMGFLSGIPEDNHYHDEVILSAPKVTQRQISNVTVWDAALDINTVRPSDFEPNWSYVRIKITSRDGMTLLSIVGLDPDDPHSYDDASNGWVDVEAWYIDKNSNTLLDEGDTIKLTGMDDRYQGSTVEVLRAGEQIGTLTLPLNFP